MKVVKLQLDKHVDEAAETPQCVFNVLLTMASSNNYLPKSHQNYAAYIKTML